MTDTFQSTESRGGVLNEVLPKNHERLERQLDLPIEVIVANPPYSVGQRTGDDNAQNLRYEKSDRRIRSTYISRAIGATQVKSLYDSYIRAIRWSSDRIKGRGVIAFITNAGWLDSVAGSGIRACFQSEFSRIYVLNLRGNARSQGKLRQREGGSLFGGNSRAPIAITLLIKGLEQNVPAEILYHDIGDYLTTEQKRETLADLQSLKNIEWDSIQPDEYHDWLSQRDRRFFQFVPLGEKKKTPNTAALFEMYSPGVNSSRDAWAYNYSNKTLSSTITRTFNFFNDEVERLKREDPDESPKDWVRYSPSDISWGQDFFQALRKLRIKRYDLNRRFKSTYRSFCKRIHYFDRSIDFTTSRVPSFFPKSSSQTRVMCIEDKGSTKPFSCLMVDCVPDLHLMAQAQCFPLSYQYTGSGSKSNNLDKTVTRDPDSRDGMRSALSDNGLRYFQNHYPDMVLDKEDIFYYVYGILHSPDYREAYQLNLFKELARIPVVDSDDDFCEFSEIGRQLGNLHIDYESADLPPNVRLNDQFVSQDLIASFSPDELRVSKIRFLHKPVGKGADRTQNRSAIVFNHNITVSDIPEDAYDYVVNGRPAIEWIMDQYQVKVDKKTGIKNDPNDYAEETAKDPAYILKLLLRIITVSLRTNELVSQLPELKIRSDFIPYDDFKQSIA